MLITDGANVYFFDNLRMINRAGCRAFDILLFKGSSLPLIIAVKYLAIMGAVKNPLVPRLQQMNKLL